MSDIFNSNYPSNTDLSDPLSPLPVSGDNLSTPYTNTSEPNDIEQNAFEQPKASSHSVTPTDSDFSYAPYTSEHSPTSADNDLSAQHPALSSYSALQKIGSGAQGTMLRAIAPDGTKVAIKVFDIQKTDNLKSLELFEREVDTLKNINIPGVPKFIEDIRAMQYLYLVEEYIDAPSLEKRMQSGQRFKLDQVIKILTNAAKILDEFYAYIPPVIHRDIKPANLLVDDDFNVWLVDFGVVAAKAPESLAMTFAGTAGYLAPEQLYGKATPASDVFSLGVTIAHLITQKSPCDMSMNGVKLDIDKYIPTNIPKWFIRILNKMIAPDPADRFPNGRQLLEELQKALQNSDQIPEISPDTNHPAPTPIVTTFENANEDINITTPSPNDAPQTATQDTPSDNKSDDPSDIDNPDNQSSKNADPPEVKLQKQINDIYQPFSEAVSNYNWYIFWVPIILLIFPLLIFFSLMFELDLEMSTFLLYWIPALLPIIYALGGLVSKASCVSDSEFEEKCRSYKEHAIELNQIYADELRLPESTKSKNLPNFTQLQGVLEGQSPFDDAQVPLSPDEDARLDTYIRLRKGPYPCLAFKPHTSKHYKSYIIAPIIITLIAIALIAFITQISALPTTWTNISLGIYFLSFLGYFSYLKFTFTKHIKRISDPEYIDASQLYIRRFVQEFRINS